MPLELYDSRDATCIYKISFSARIDFKTFPGTFKHNLSIISDCLGGGNVEVDSLTSKIFRYTQGLLQKILR